MDDLRFPIGRFALPGTLTDSDRAAAMIAIESTPANVRAAIAHLSDAQLDTPYRPVGWTLRQVVHHLPDSHLNAYVRFKLALTEDVPPVKPYREAAWAALPDSRTTPVETSLRMLDALHERWLHVLRAMSPGDFARKVNHPENGEMSLDTLLALYAWHGAHHTAHLMNGARLATGRA
jgi:uncharacterized damage-inducible protein DinB